MVAFKSMSYLIFLVIFKSLILNRAEVVICVVIARCLGSFLSMTVAGSSSEATVLIHSN